MELQVDAVFDDEDDDDAAEAADDNADDVDRVSEDERECVGRSFVVVAVEVDNAFVGAVVIKES